MQIPDGKEFGNRLPRARQTNIGNVGGGVANAVGGAFKELGAAFAKIDKENKANASVDMGNYLLQRHKEIDAINNDLKTGVREGRYNPDDVVELYNKRVSELKTPEFKYLDDRGQQRFKTGLDTIDYQGKKGVVNVFNQARITKAQGSVLEGAELVNQYVERTGDIEGGLKRFDDPAFIETLSLAFGAEQGKQKLKDAKRGATVGYFQTKIFGAADTQNIGALRQLKRDVLDIDKHTNLESQDRIKLANSIKTSIKQIEDQWKAAQAESLVNLQYKIQDDSAKIEAGLNVSDPLTNAQIMSARPSNPAARERFDRMIEGYRETLQLQPVLSTVVTGTLEEAQKAIDSIRPSADDENFALKQQRYNFVISKHQQAVNAREKDPAAWLIQNSEPVQKAYQAYVENPEKGADFLRAVMAQKQIFTINSNKILPDEMVNKINQDIEDGKIDGIFSIKAIASQFGPYANQAVSQMQKKGSGPIKVLLAVEDNVTSAKIYKLRNTSTAELAKPLSKVTIDSIDKAISTNFAGAYNTFVSQGGGIETINEFAEQARRLAYDAAARGENPTTAAQKAYEKIIGESYDFNDTWRLPKKLNLDNYDVYDGANAYLDSLTEKDINDFSIYGDPRIPLEDNKKDALAALKYNGQWITAPDESGLVLTLNDVPVYDNNNNLIQVSFEDLANNGVKNRTWRNKTGKFLNSSGTFEARRKTQKEKDEYNRAFNTSTLMK